MVDDQQSVVRNEPVTWRTIGQSVQGAAHKRSGLPNQDAIHWWPKNGMGSLLILAVADGHGSSKYFRSNHGARLAVETAVHVLQAFAPSSRGQIDGDSSISEHSIDLLDRGLDLSNPTVVGRMAEEQLPKLLSRRWLEAVDDHIQSHPIEKKELDRLTESDPDVAGGIMTSGITPVAYGTTLLSVVITETFILYLQIGDGDILIVTESEEVHRPITGDNRLFGNETTSLCTKEAWKDFRVKVQPTIDGSLPALILISTDGYANSFRNEESFQQVGPDILQLADQYGLDGVQSKLKTWLDDSSQKGSGDDITLGVIKPLKDSDRDVVSRKADAALTIGEEAHKRASEASDQLASIQDRFESRETSIEERFKPLEQSFGGIADLEKQVQALKEREKRFEFFERRLRRLWWAVVSGVVILIAAEILFHLAIGRRQAAAYVPVMTPSPSPIDPATQNAQKAVDATPAPTISQSPKNPSSNVASAPRRNRSSARPGDAGTKQKKPGAGAAKAKPGH